MVRRNQRPCLPDVVAQDMSKRRVQQVSRRVVSSRIGATSSTDRRGHTVADRDPARHYLPQVSDHVPECASVLHINLQIRASQRPRIADLSAALRIEGSPIQHHADGVAGRGPRDPLATRDDGDHFRLGFNRLVTRELGRRLEFGVTRCVVVVCKCRLLSGALSLLLERQLELRSHRRFVRQRIIFARNFRRDFERQAIRVVELKRVLPRDRVGIQLGNSALQQRAAGRQGAPETMLFLVEHIGDQR